MSRRLPHLLLLLLFPALLQAKSLAAAELYKEGSAYQVLATPVPTSVGKNQIEVAEVFFYGCPHCRNLEPLASSWKKSQAQDVKLVRIPAFFGPNIWQTYAQLYYTLEVLIQDPKKFEMIHRDVFTDILENRKRLDDVKEMAAYAQEKAGIDPKKFEETYHSFGVSSMMNQAFSKVRGYQIEGTPAMVVDGRYVVSPSRAVPLDKMLNVVDFLVEKVRKERESKAQKNTSVKG